MPEEPREVKITLSVYDTKFNKHNSQKQTNTQKCINQSKVIQNINKMDYRQCEIRYSIAFGEKL